ncbi:TetR/AcrR family transcriptional regulator [Streptomyces sp. NRRL S-337]|uniref:TetR/AcrR family transcriptional regulator n=1 Tax=Streptomyces sp. NRRL S-337 TaxID=1463900 RepID=UPI0004CC3C34|nr:TetR/AcrR family transcriptional regulator [Streptomyces sp. NRRL S-337]
MPTGLRELKKQQARRAISDAATRLFLERGFEAVTIADIATAAQVAKMTVTNYFPRKEDLALDHHETFRRSLAVALTSRHEGESALVGLRREYLAAVARHDALVGFSGQAFARMITGSPTLAARLRELHQQREDALAEALAAETAEPADALTPRAAAALLATAHRTLFHHALDLTIEGRTNRQIADALPEAAEEVFALLEPSLADYAVREAA